MLNRTTTGQKILYYSLLVLPALIIIFPIYYMIVVSLKLPRDIYRLPSLLPVNPTLRNYVDLLSRDEFLINILNSMIVAGLTTLMTTALRSSRAAIADWSDSGGVSGPTLRTSKPAWDRMSASIAISRPAPRQ